MIVIAELELPDELHFLSDNFVWVDERECHCFNANFTPKFYADADCHYALRFNSTHASFEEWWEKQCQDDYRVAYQAFTTGVPLFIVLLAQMGWITFSKYDPLSKNFAASVVTIVATVPAGWWFSHCHQEFRKWNMSGPTKDEDTAVRERPAAWS